MQKQKNWKFKVGRNEMEAFLGQAGQSALSKPDELRDIQEFAPFVCLALNLVA